MKETDITIQSLYARAAEDNWGEFRSGALRMVCERLGAQAAAWVTHSSSRMLGEYTVHPRNLAAEPEVLMTMDVEPDNPETELEDGAGNGREGLVLRHRHLQSGLLSTVAFWFANGKRPAEFDDAQRVVNHMVESAALALRLFIARDERLAHLGRASRGATALVDASGALYAASPNFRELVEEEFDASSLQKLPFTIPDDALSEDGLFSQGNLRFRSSRVGSLYMLHARQPQPLDSLSPREQQIARALGRGKTFKSVARQCGIAVSTVANHASRIYRKLGIYRREDLVELVRSPQGSLNGRDQQD